MKKIAIYLALVVVLSLTFVIPCFATVEVSGDTITWDGDISQLYARVAVDLGDSREGFYSFVKVADNAPDYDSITDGRTSVTDIFYDGTLDSENWFITVGDENYSPNAYCNFGYFVAIYAADVVYPVGDTTVVFDAPGLYAYRIDAYHNGTFEYYQYPASITVSGFQFQAVSDPEVPAPTGIYWDIFDILHTHIYGGAELTSDMNLVLTMLSTTACLFCFAVPFMVVWWVIKRIT